MVSRPVVVVGWGSESGNVALRVRYEGSCNFLNTVHVVPRCRSPNPSPPQQQDTIPYAVKISVLRSWRWAKDCPKHVELILEINKLLLLHLVGSSVLLYLHRWCTVEHKSKLAPCASVSNVENILYYRTVGKSPPLMTSTFFQQYWTPPPPTPSLCPQF